MAQPSFPRRFVNFGSSKTKIYQGVNNDFGGSILSHIWHKLVLTEKLSFAYCVVKSPIILGQNRL